MKIAVILWAEEYLERFVENHTKLDHTATKQGVDMAQVAATILVANQLRELDSTLHREHT